jgi:alpha-tubulin suppressor-like RCC1 family protein
VDYGAVPVQWRIVGAGDFNLDAHEDLVWRNVNTGDLTIWMMRNGAIASFHTVGGVPTVWEVEGIGFLNYDGYSDLVWRNRTTGDVIYWFMRGTSIMQSISIGAVPTAWRVVGVGNVPRGTTDPFHSTRDAQNDVMWYNQTSGEVLVWTDRVFEQGVYNPGTYETLSLGAVPTNWYIEATGDYDGDGDTDIMWRNGAGALLVWTLQNGALAQIGDLGAVPTAWKLRTMLKPNRSFQMTRVAGAAAGDHFCGTAAAGEVYCWGDNRARQLGTAASTWTFLGNQIQFSNTPVRAAGAPTNVTGFALGQAYSCALTGAGSVHCWGTGPFPTPSGDGYTPTLQSGIPALASIAGGQSHACGLTSAGAAWCWGWNGSGQLGNALSTNTSGASNPARAVDGGLTFTALASGSEHTCGLTSTGQAYCWGRNDVGQLGDGSTANKAAPTLVTGGRTFSQLTAGHRSTCGRATDGSTYCWGTVYQEGNAPIGTFTAPRLIANSSGFSTIAGAGYVTCGLRGGQAFCWGLNNGEGIVGDNTFFNIREGATAVEGPARFSALAGSFGATCGLTSDGTAYCWGNNEFGDAGTAGVPLALAPMPVLTR